MNLALLSLRSPFLDNDKVYPPLGIFHIESAIKKYIPNTNIDILDEYDLDNPEQFKKYDHVGVSVMTPQRDEAIKVLQHIKKYSPNTITIAGGPHIKHYLEECEEQPWDYLVPFDGEPAMVQILSKTAPSRILSYKLSSKEWANLPPLNRLNYKDFFNNYKYMLDGKKSATMLTATGCPMACTFCEDSNTMVRWRSIDTLIREMDDIVEMDYQGVYIFDDLFAIAMKKVKPICKELSKHDLIYRCNGQANFFTKWGEDFAKMLADTGCKEIAFGHESGSQTILDNVCKRTTIQQNIDSVLYAKKQGIKVKSFIMLGLPGETWQTLSETEDYLDITQPDNIQFAVYMPYKGTKIREHIDNGDYIDLKMIVDRESGAYGIKGGETSYEIRTACLSEDDIRQARNYFVNKFSNDRR